MCISCCTYFDWNLTGQNPQLTVTAISDFPQPAFDQLGMQAVPALNLQNNPGRGVSGSLGYNLRYWQWKSNIDTVHAGFRAGAAYQSWVASLDGWHVLTASGAWSYQSMKVRPQQLNSIFVPQIDSANCSVAFDQLGMQAVPALNLQNNPGRTVSGSLGYNLRYWQWKSNVDTVHAGFRAGAAYQSWAAPLDGWQVLTSSGT